MKNIISDENSKTKKCFSECRSTPGQTDYPVPTKFGRPIGMVCVRSHWSQFDKFLVVIVAKGVFQRKRKMSEILAWHKWLGPKWWVALWSKESYSSKVRGQNEKLSVVRWLHNAKTTSSCFKPHTPIRNQVLFVSVLKWRHSSARCSSGASTKPSLFGGVKKFLLHRTVGFNLEMTSL